MIKTQRILLWSISLFLMCAINLHAQNTMGFLSSLLGTIRTPAPDTSGFIDTLTCANAVNGHVVWQESPFSGEWYNFVFTDNFSFTYKYYGSSAPPPQEGIVTVSAFDAAMGDFRTSYCGPRFSLLGYVVEDSLWCIITSSLSPEYFSEQNQNEDAVCQMNETWYEWRQFWDSPPPQYLYEETYVNHDLNIWGRLIPNKTVQVWWGADAFACWESYRNYDLIQARNIRVNSPIQSEPGTWYDSLDDYMDSGSGVWTYLGEFNAGDTSPPPGEEPPGWAKCTFVERINRDLSKADNWLPEPGKEIGLSFLLERTQAPATVAMRYIIYNISTWQGECMNFPVDTLKPVATNSNKFFDFTVVDTAKYNVEVHDYDIVGEDERGSTQTSSVRVYIVTADLDFPADSTEIHDVMWLKAHDYGAKAIVTPCTGQCWQALMQPHTTAFGQKVWSISVPRDDDGQAFTGYNWGDFMADPWEEVVLGLPYNSSDSSVVSFTPFCMKCIIDSTDNRVATIYTDQDYYPTGRDIKGDGFCNWEEYRGFITVGDQYGFYPSTNPFQHKRLNPRKKEVMVHFMPNVEYFSQEPGWISALPDTMAYLVKHLTHLEDNDSLRMDLNRGVNINKYGAWYPYYSRKASIAFPEHFSTTNNPAYRDYQNALVFWPQYRGNDPVLTPCANAYGYAKGIFAFNDSCYVPNNVAQMAIRPDYIESTRGDMAYYTGAAKDAVWNADKAKAIQFSIAHETGHCIGMTHDLYTVLYIMAYKIPIDVTSNRLLFYPPFTQQYSNNSIPQISLRIK